MQHENSKTLYEQALEIIPGGVNSPVRACKSVGADPVFIERAIGCSGLEHLVACLLERATELPPRRSIHDSLRSRHWILLEGPPV